MLVPAPYKAPEKKAKKKVKEVKGGPRPKGPSDTVSGETDSYSSEDEEEEEESDSPFKGKGRKRAATENAGKGAPRRKLNLPDSSDSESGADFRKQPRSKPLAEFPPLTLPSTPLSSGSSLPTDMAESDTPPQAQPPIKLGNTEASLVAASTQAAEVSELNRKLQIADAELDRVNKRFDETQVGAAEVETLKGALAQAKKEAKMNEAAADKAAAELEAEQVSC
nr:mitotic apparatus protein p62-like [Aegilops tauschii subsp. strangulata]